MSDDNKTPEPLATSLMAALKQYQEITRKALADEQARRDRLTPSQRAAEVKALADHQRALKNEKLAKPFKKMDSTILKRESWTIEKFSWLLVGENPDERGSWLDPENDSAADEQKKIFAVLASCVDVGLFKPLNSAADATKLRFRTSDLIAVARVKQLGRHQTLEPFLPQTPRPIPLAASPTPARLPAATAIQPAPVPTPKEKKLAKQGTAKRELGVIQRRKQLVAFTRELVAAGLGTATNSGIRLTIQAKVLNKQFRDKHPEWKSISDKRFEIDRAECKPPISLMMGRPRKPVQ